VILMAFERILEDESSLLNLTWGASGFALEAIERKSGARRSLPVDPSSMDLIVAAWPAFRDKIQSGAGATTAAPPIASPIAFRDGPGASSSPSRSPHSIGSGSGAPTSPSGRANGAGSSPEAPKTLL
jgi:hypothetical protein